MHREYDARKTANDYNKIDRLENIMATGPTKQNPQENSSPKPKQTQQGD